MPVVVTFDVSLDVLNVVQLVYQVQKEQSVPKVHLVYLVMLVHLVRQQKTVDQAVLDQKVIPVFHTALIQF